MTEADLDAVMAWEKAGQAAPWTRRVFRDCLAAGYDCRMIGIGDETVGFVIVSRVLDESHLLNIVIDHRWRGHGIARRVLEDLLAELAAERISLMFLEVRESNLAARRLYEQLGFHENGFRHGYYHTADGDRESAVLMMVELGYRS